MGPRAETTSRKALIGPVLAGVLLDLVDFATYGPIGLWTGLAVGGLAGYFLATSMGVAADRRWTYAAVAGAYCMMPFTAFLPLGTLLGTLIRWREGAPPEPEPAAAGKTLEAEYKAHWDDEE